MAKNAKSASSSRRSMRKASSARAKGNTVGRRMIAGLNEALAHARGKLALPTYTVAVPDQVDVTDVRRRLGLSQSAFARAFGLDVTALHAWEQGRRRPDRAARVLLAVIARNPRAVLRALAE